MSNAGLGTGCGFAPTTNSDVVVSEYFLIESDNDNFLTEDGDYLTIADHSDN